MCVYRIEDSEHLKKAFLNRALDTDEFLPIRIDTVKSGSPFLLHLGFMLPTSDSQTQNEKTWLLTSSGLEFNGIELQQFDNKLDIDKLEVINKYILFRHGFKCIIAFKVIFN